MRKLITIAIMAVTVGLTGAVAAHADSAVVAVQQQSNVLYVVSNPNGAPVRSGPGKSFPVVGWLDSGTTLGGTVVGNWVDLGNDNYVWLGKLDIAG